MPKGPGSFDFPAQTGISNLTGAEESSEHNLDTETQECRKIREPKRPGGRTPMALASQIGAGRSARPATQPFPLLKFAPKPLSRLCDLDK